MYRNMRRAKRSVDTPSLPLTSAPFRQTNGRGASRVVSSSSSSVVESSTVASGREDKVMNYHFDGTPFSQRKKRSVKSGGGQGGAQSSKRAMWEKVDGGEKDRPSSSSSTEAEALAEASMSDAAENTFNLGRDATAEILRISGFAVLGADTTNNNINDTSILSLGSKSSIASLTAATLEDNGVKVLTHNLLGEITLNGFDHPPTDITKLSQESAVGLRDVQDTDSSHDGMRGLHAGNSSYVQSTASFNDLNNVLDDNQEEVDSTSMGHPQTSELTPLASLLSKEHRGNQSTSDGPVDDITTSLITKLQATQEGCIRDLDVYANRKGLRLSPSFTTKAASRANITISILLSFAPERDDEMTPCLDAISNLFKLILINDYDHDEVSALTFMNTNLIWFERCPLVLTWDFDSKNRKEFSKHLDVTDPPMHHILTCVTEDLRLEAGLMFGERALEFCIEYPDVMPDSILVQNEILSHPENWVNRRLDTHERRAILGAITIVIARVLGVPPKIIPEKDAHKYLYAMSKASCRKKWRSNSEFYELSPNDIQARYLERRDIYAGPGPQDRKWSMPESDIVAAGLLKFGCNGWFKISRKLNRSQNAVRRHVWAVLHSIIQERSIAIDVNVPWTDVERALFERGVVALGWGKWKRISRSFFSGSRSNKQLRDHRQGMERFCPETKQRLINEHAARHAIDNSPAIPVIEVAMPGTDPAFDEIPTSDNTTAINEMLTEDTIIKSMPALDDTPLAVDYTTAFYEMTTITLNEPDNEQIKIVAV